MSVESISRVLNVVDMRLTYLDRLVLIGIANHDGDGGAWPSLSTLARYAGCADDRSVRRSVGRLVELGYVERFVNGGGTHSTPNDRRPNRYVLRWPEISTGGTDGSSRGVTDQSSRSDHGMTDESSRGGTDQSPEPSSEPSIRKDARGDYNASASEAVDNLAVAGMVDADPTARAATFKHAPMSPHDIERARALRMGLIQPGESLQSELVLDETEGSSE
jgi:hypothetical protein